MKSVKPGKLSPENVSCDNPSPPMVFQISEDFTQITDLARVENF